jgi:hypothetical protein
MGIGGLKQALIDLGRLSNQLLHDLPMLPGLFSQCLKPHVVTLGLTPQGLRRSLEQISSELEGLLLKRKGILYGSAVGSLGGLENLLKILLEICSKVVDRRFLERRGVPSLRAIEWKCRRSSVGLGRVHRCKEYITTRAPVSSSCLTST